MKTDVRKKEDVSVVQMYLRNRQVVGERLSTVYLLRPI
jgi:hypothetical protein